MPRLIRRGQFEQGGGVRTAAQRILINPEHVVFARQEADGSVTVKLVTGDIVAHVDGTLDELERLLIPRWGS